MPTIMSMAHATKIPTLVVFHPVSVTLSSSVPYPPVLDEVLPLDGEDGQGKGLGVGTPPLSPNIVNVFNDGCVVGVELSSDDSSIIIVVEFFHRVIVGLSVLIVADAENEEGVNDGTNEPGDGVGVGDDKSGAVVSPVVVVDDDDEAKNWGKKNLVLSVEASVSLYRRASERNARHSTTSGTPAPRMATNAGTCDLMIVILENLSNKVLARS